jgi:adenosylmethionine-8-amino-7-oxononanoate aminotransferase
MISQRVGDGVNPAEPQSRKWTAKGTMNSHTFMSDPVSCDVGLTLVAGDMLVSRKAHIHL